MSSLKKISPVIVVSLMIIATLVVAGSLTQETLAQSKAVPMHLAKLPCFEDGGGPGPDPECGNNVIDAGEACDGSNLDGRDCKYFGHYYPDELRCHAPGHIGECTFDTSQCRDPECGNDVAECEIGEECYEECDGLDVRGVTCADLRHDPTVPGVPTCYVAGHVYECTLYTSLCHTCGDGLCVPEAHEECDGLDLCGATCAEVGGYPERTPGCTERSLPTEPGCELDLCPCGDEIEIYPTCWGEGLCDELSDYETCTYFSGCSWEGSVPGPSPSPASPTGNCTGVFSCGGSTSEECGISSVCHWQDGFNGCWGPPMDCGYVDNVHLTNSGMHCQAAVECEGFGTYFFSDGSSICDFNVTYVLPPRPDGNIYMLRFNNITGTSAEAYVRKLLQELPYED